MAKREDTLALEKSLLTQTRKKRLYGCEEVTIGFQYNGQGNEVVDFMSMDTKGILKCYELKVTLPDLKSDARLSFYGHYNYLVVSMELYWKVKDFSNYIPDFVGILAGTSLESMRKAKRVEIGTDKERMLKESLIRSLFWKMDKYRAVADMEQQKALQSKVRKLEKERDQYYHERNKAQRLISEYEWYRMLNENLEDFNFEKQVEEERRKMKSREEKR